MVKFSNKTIDRLIDLVSEQCELYDGKNKSIKKKAKIWEDIATKLNKKGLTGEACKTQWTKLKKSYDHFKKTDKVATTRSGPKLKFFNKMCFLDVNQQQGNKKKPAPGNTDGQVKKQASILKKIRPASTDVSAVSESDNSAQKYAVHLNISGIEINVGSKTKAETPKVCEKLPHAKPNLKCRPQRKNEDESMDHELKEFSTTVFTTLRDLPRDLQIKAHRELLEVLTKYKEEAHISMSVSGCSSSTTL